MTRGSFGALRLAAVHPRPLPPRALWAVSSLDNHNTCIPVCAQLCVVFMCVSPVSVVDGLYHLPTTCVSCLLEAVFVELFESMVKFAGTLFYTSFNTLYVPTR